MNNMEYITDEVRNCLGLCRRGKFGKLFEIIDNKRQDKNSLKIIANELELFTGESPILEYELCHLRWIISREHLKEADETIRYQWLRICLNTRKDSEIEYYLDLRGIDREKEVKICIVKKGVENKKHAELKHTDIDSFFLDQPQMIYLKVIADWYMIRYNIEMSRRLINIIEGGKLWAKVINNMYPLGFLKGFALLLVFLFSLFAVNPLVGKIQAFMPFLRDINANYLSAYIEWNLKIIIALIYVIALIFGVLIVFLSKNNILWMHLLVPRLIGAIIIGFIPLVMTQEVWDFAINISPARAVFIILIFLIVSGSYLFIEVRNQKLQSNWESIKRAFYVFLYGLNISLIISIVLNDLVAQYFLSSDNSSSFIPQAGIAGVVFPQVVIFFASAALLIGIFIQVFWEEKTITEPL